MKILISGGGLAGLTTAYWLHRYGHQPVVIERAPALRRDGYGLDFFGTGYDVAERMGIIETLAQKQIFLNKDGADSEGSGNGRLGKSHQFGHRSRQNTPRRSPASA